MYVVTTAVAGGTYAGTVVIAYAVGGGGGEAYSAGVYTGIGAGT